MASQNPPTADQWRKLYQLMDQIKELAPWTWMDETQVFGVQHPETGELGFVSVMGNLGEHYAIAVYQGALGLYRFWNIQLNQDEMAPGDLLETPQLQASFEDRDFLHAEDRAMIKQLGLKYRGKQAWPMFRSHVPAYLPWTIDGAEANLLEVALTQLLEVAPRLRTNPRLLPRPDGQRWLMRVPRKEGDVVVWEDQVKPVEPPKPHDLMLRMNMGALQAVKAMPRSRVTLEMDFFLMLSPIKEGGRDGRPFFPYALLTVEERGGTVLGIELISPVPALESAWEQVPAHAVIQMANAGIRPNTVRVRDELLHSLLTQLSHELGFKLVKRRHMRALDEAKASLMAYMIR